MSSPESNGRDDEDSKHTAPDMGQTLDELVNKIGELGLSEGSQKKFADIASDRAGRFVGFTGCNIGNAGAALLAERLSKNTTRKTLFLQNNDIGDDGVAVLAECLTKNTSLQELNLNDNNIGDDGASALAESLTKNITLLRLYMYGNNIGNDGAAAIADGLRKNNTLQQISLTANNLTHSGLLALAKAFRWNKNLQILNADPKGTVYEEASSKQEIGRGEFGSVHLASTEKSNKDVVQKTSHDTSKREEIYERLILQGLPQHPNVVKLAALADSQTLLLEAHMGGSLRDYARKHEDGTPLQPFFSYSHGMCLAIQHLHRNGIIHRDIALRNYVLTEDLLTAVLVDFGLSWPIEEEKSVEIRPGEMMPFRQCAPEVLSTLQYSKASDIWQLGLAIWQLLQRGKQPFFVFSNGQQLVQYLQKKMVQDDAPIPLSFKKNSAPRKLLETVKEIVVFCCSFEPAERPTATQLVQKIENLRRLDDVEVEAEKEMPKYVRDKSVVDAGLMAYNYTDYNRLKTGGQSDYIDLNKDLEEHQYQKLDKFPDVDMEDEGGAQEHEYQELEALPKTA